MKSGICQEMGKLKLAVTSNKNLLHLIRLHQVNEKRSGEFAELHDDVLQSAHA